MSLKRTALGAAAIGLPLALVMTSAGSAAGHGATGDPASRSVACAAQQWSPSNTGCKAALAVGTDHIGDWKSVVQGGAMNYSPDAGSGAPRHRSLIPDGTLCSANNSKYAGLDLARADFPTTSLPSGQAYELEYDVSAMHNPYRLEMYVTKDGYDPTKPLKWSDLEDTPFLSADNTQAAPRSESSLGANLLKLKAVLPQKQGHHLIYTIWHGLKKPDGSVQSTEAFYSCSDVNFK